MCPSSFCGWRPFAVGLGLIALFCVLSPQAKAEKMASLSGSVYLDYDYDGLMDAGDYAIRNARITLRRSDDSAYSLTATTDKDGYYLFENLAPITTGTYSLTIDKYTCLAGHDNLGVLYDSLGVQVADKTLYGVAHNTPGDPLKGSFTGITLQSGFKGASYNFGEDEYPLELLSKRLYMDWGTPNEVITVVPEPASFGLLAMGVLALGFVRARRR